MSQRRLLPPSSGWKKLSMKEVGSSKIQVSIYQTSFPHIPEEHNVQNPHIDISCTGTNPC
jgi:hypothetical protein